MRLFKHGNCLAIVVPDSICKKLNLGENSELEFFEVEDGLMLLASRDYIEKKLKKTIAPLLSTVAVPPVMMFSSESEARVASKRFEAQLRKGELIAVLCDKRYYLLSVDFYNNLSSKIAPFLNSEKTLSDLVRESGLSTRDVSVVLVAMKEKGEVIEKKRGCFVLVK